MTLTAAVQANRLILGQQEVAQDQVEVTNVAIHIDQTAEAHTIVEGLHHEEDLTADLQTDLVEDHHEVQIVMADENQADMEISRLRSHSTEEITQEFMVESESSRCLRCSRVMRWRYWMMQI